ncbi:MAG: NAD-dependent epimerase/dehydratase family protein [Flavobacteriales bacterium]|nr:NAD-dependent epimerase/dehydratase family protein [Flavobacteriales bacterium]
MGKGVLVIGASGQIGTELVMALRQQHGTANVVACDIKTASDEVKASGPFELLDILDKDRLYALVKQYEVSEIYLLAALLSATAEQKVMPAWKLNMDGLFNVLELAREGHIAKVYWPSSIAIFGPTTPKVHTPQRTIAEPTTVYGISKLTGERWCEYYFNRYGVDVRSLRYPGLIGYKSAPGGGTTDYAVDIFHKAAAGEPFTCFLNADTRLPMMYMPDAIAATLGIMNAEAANVKVRSSYNIAALDFTPAELAGRIRENMPDFRIDYAPDHRQAIADSWPGSIDDSVARKDWGWKNRYDLKAMTRDMLVNLAPESIR